MSCIHFFMRLVIFAAIFLVAWSYFSRLLFSFYLLSIHTTDLREQYSLIPQYPRYFREILRRWYALASAPVHLFISGFVFSLPLVSGWNFSIFLSLFIFLLGQTPRWLECKQVRFFFLFYWAYFVSSPYVHLEYVSVSVVSEIVAIYRPYVRLVASFVNSKGSYRWHRGIPFIKG